MLQFAVRPFLFSFFAFFTLLHPLAAQQKDDPSAKALAYIDLLAAGQFQQAAATFDPAMAKGMSVDQLRDAWNSVAAQGGKLKGREVLSSEKVTERGAQYTAVIVACDFEKAPMESRLVYGPDGKLSGMFFRPARPRIVGKEELWLGDLQAGPVKLRIMLHLGEDAKKNKVAFFDSLDQGQKGIPFDSVKIDGKKARFEAKQLGVIYEGEFNDDRTEFKGAWKQGPSSLTLNLKPVESAASEGNRPQTPKGPFPYDSKDVSYPSLDPEVKIAGTLTLPRGAGPHPAVLLITGSGAQDRDETIFGHKPFWVIADYLTRRGIAVLRVDDRGVGGSTGPADSTSQDFAQDVKGGLAFLRSQPEIDPKRIGLLGHSEGGVIALMVAAEDPQVAFLVLMAGSALPGKEVLLQQGEAILKAGGASPEALATQRKMQETLFEIVDRTPDNAAALAAMEKAVAELSKSLDNESRKAFEEQGGQMTARLKMITGNWFRFFLKYDPREAAAKVKCPVLALNGEKDLQVLPKENLAALEAALKKADNRDFEVRELPGLNHLFQTCETGHLAEYGRIEETISPKVLETIGDWISKRMRP